MLKRYHQSHIWERIIIVTVLLFTITACGATNATTGAGTTTATAVSATSISTTPTHRQASILADIATLRAEPRSDAQLIGTLKRGTLVDVIGISPDNGWYLILVPGAGSSSQQAWIAASLATPLSSEQGRTGVTILSPSPTRTPSPTPATATLPSGYAVFTSEVKDASWSPMPDPNNSDSQFTLPAGTVYRYQGERQEDRCRIVLLPPADRPNDVPQPWVPCQSILAVPPGYAVFTSEVKDASWSPMPDPNNSDSQFTLPAGTVYRYQGERQEDRCRIALLPPADRPNDVPQPWVPCQSILEVPPEPLPTLANVATAAPPETPADTATAAATPPETPTDTASATAAPPNTPTSTNDIVPSVIPLPVTDTP